MSMNTKRRRTSKRQLSGILAVGCLGLLACQSALSDAPAAAPLSARIVDVGGQPVHAHVLINGRAYETDADGRFTAPVPTDPVVTLELSAEGYYPGLQTFSRAELLETGTMPGNQLTDFVLVERKPGRTLFVFGGDTMMARRFYSPHPEEPALIRDGSVLDDSKALLAYMKPYLERADYASVNLETPILTSPPGPAAPKFVTFYSAPETLEALKWSGVDYVALGNNHTFDFLDAGLRLTMDAVRRSGLGFSGAGANEAEALRPHRETLNGAIYDFHSFVGWPGGTPSQSATLDKGGATLGTTQNLVTASAQSQSQGSVPIVQFHGGLEYVEEPTLSVETRVKATLDAGAALAIAHHPHVLQGLELHDGKLIAWSLGNFLFDQYFYSAQASALVYVWMDGDRFHHAELAPIYIKGYVPGPATGPMRQHINQRLMKLSLQRATRLCPSGGHLALLSTNAQCPSPEAGLEKLETQTGRSIYRAPQNGVQVGGAYRLGVDLLARGSFDDYSLFGTHDRSWLEPAEAFRVDRNPGQDASDLALFANVPSGSPAIIGMRKFTRVFDRGAPMSVAFDAEASVATQADIFIQVRAERQGLTEALENGQKILIGQVQLEAGTNQRVEVNFDAPRVGARALRVLIEASTQTPQSGQIIIDNLALIEWQTPWLKPETQTEDARFASHLQVEPNHR